MSNKQIEMETISMPRWVNIVAKQLIKSKTSFHIYPKQFKIFLRDIRVKYIAVTYTHTVNVKTGSFSIPQLVHHKHRLTFPEEKQEIV